MKTDYTRLQIGGRNTDIGQILENVIYLELIRQGYEVHIGQIDGKEIDFIAMNDIDTIYIQVVAAVRDTSTLEKELYSLENIKDNYPKLILTLDEDHLQIIMA